MSEIKQGYKQTDLGVIPEDWEIKGITKNFTLKARIGWQGLTTAEYLPTGDYCLVTGTDFQNGFINWNNCVYVEKSRYVQDRNIQLKVGDVLLTKDGTIGKVAFVEKLTKPTTLNSGVFVVRPKNESTDNLFFYYILMSFYFDDFLDKIIAGSTIIHLYQKDLVNFKYVLPSLSEQQAIASVLSDIDSLITVLDKKIAKKQALKQGAMQQLLTAKKRLPGFTEPWEEKKIENILKINKGQMLTSDQFIEGSIPVIAGGKSPAGFHAFSNRKPNTITISASGANAGFVNFHTIPIYATDCSTIEESDKYEVRYIYYLLTLYQDVIYKAQTGGAQPHIHSKDVYPIEVLYSSNITEQQAIAQILTDMDKEIEHLQEKRNKYTALKQGAMQKLLTGQIRLKH